MSSRVRPPFWLWFNLLSLDAPLVALVWQDFLYRCYPTMLLVQGRAVLGLTVWAIYLADRLLDVRHPGSPLESIRHRFYRMHRSFALTLLGAVVSVDLVVAGLWLHPAVFANGLLLVAAVVIYLVTFPFTGWTAAVWKKPTAALLFTAGTFLIAWTTSGHPVPKLFWPAAAFCALCLGNLLMVGRWSQGPGHSVSREGIGVIVLVALVACLHGSSWFSAILYSAVGLCALAYWGRSISRDARCVLADALLLTPLLFR